MAWKVQFEMYNSEHLISKIPEPFSIEKNKLFDKKFLELCQTSWIICESMLTENFADSIHPSV